MNFVLILGGLVLSVPSLAWTPNFCAALLMPDNRTVRHLAPLCRPEPGGPVFGYHFGESDIRGDGIAGSHGASRMAAVDNDAPDRIGGRGTSRAPLAPPPAEAPATPAPKNMPPVASLSPGVLSTSKLAIGSFAFLPLKNASMTDGKDKPDHWTQTWVGKGKIKVSRDTATYHSAPASLALEAVDGAAQAQVSQSFEVKGGERVKLSGWVRADGGANAMLALQSFTTDWKGIDFKVVGNAITGLDWRKVEGEVTVPPNAARAAVVLMLQGPGIAWLDDVSTDGTDPGAGAQPKSVVRPKPQGPPKAKHSCDPAEGFWPDYPQAWRQVLEGQIKRAKEGKVPVVFLGDSLMQGWSEQSRWKEHYVKLGALNLGVGGDGTPQLLYRIDKSILDGLEPKVVMLSVGVNNVWPGFDATDTVKGIQAVVAAIQAKAPGAKILLVSNWHFFDKGDGGSRRRVDTINAALKDFADGRKVRLVEISEHLLKPDRELELKYYAGDKLHLSAEGYRLWAEAMDPVLAELLK